MPGPLPKPAELKLLEGNRGHRPLDLSSIFRPEVGLPSPPKWLGKDAVKAWKRLTPELMRYNLIATVDRDALAMLCQTIGRVDVLERSLLSRMNELTKAGLDAADAFMDSTPNGMRIQSALYQVLNKEQEKLHKLLETFGLRPDARARVSRAIAAQLQLFEGGNKSGAEMPANAGQSGFSDFQ